MKTLALRQGWSVSEAMSANVDGNWKSIKKNKNKNKQTFGIEHIAPVYISRKFTSLMQTQALLCRTIQPLSVISFLVLLGIPKNIDSISKMFTSPHVTP